MSYLNDNPVPLLLLLAAAAFVAFLSGSSKGRSIAGLCVLLGVGLFFLERYLISPAEEVELQLETMLQHFKDRDLDAIASQISADRQNLTAIARNGLELVDIDDSFHIKSVDVTFGEAGKNATAMIRANGTVTHKHGGGGGHVPTFWKTVWKPEGGQWKMNAVTRLNPANGAEIEHLSAN
jgi:hypothetical protein